MTIDLLLASLVLLPIVVLAFLIVREQRRLLREIRKLAELYPPYPQVDGEDDKRDKSIVVIDKQWDEALDGRD